MKILKIFEDLMKSLLFTLFLLTNLQIKAAESDSAVDTTSGGDTYSTLMTKLEERDYTEMSNAHLLGLEERLSTAEKLPTTFIEVVLGRLFSEQEGGKDLNKAAKVLMQFFNCHVNTFKDEQTENPSKLELQKRTYKALSLVRANLSNAPEGFFPEFALARSLSGPYTFKTFKSEFFHAAGQIALDVRKSHPDSTLFRSLSRTLKRKGITISATDRIEKFEGLAYNIFYKSWCTWNDISFPFQLSFGGNEDKIPADPRVGGGGGGGGTPAEGSLNSDASTPLISSSAKKAPKKKGSCCSIM